MDNIYFGISKVIGNRLNIFYSMCMLFVNFELINN